LKIIYLNEIDSTQKFLIEKLKLNELIPPICVVAKKQIAGVGSRGSEWVSVDENLFFSFAINLNELPKDLPLASASIYFGFLMKKTLNEFGSKLWLKWANDLYINDKKVGGILTSKIGENLICGIGINLNTAPKEFEILDIKVTKDEILKSFFDNLNKKILWEDIFLEYKIEFEKSKNYTFTHKNSKISIKDAILNSDGSILINEENIYSFR